MSWQDNLHGNAALTSPSGIVFLPQWIGDSREMEKKLGIFEYPNVRGANVQDLDVGPTRYPLTIYFEGENNDVDAENFFTACKERGPWAVFHPVKGNLTLQLVKIKEEIEPVSSGNITKIATDWIEPGTNAPLVFAPDVASQISDATGSVYEDFGDAINTSSPLALAQVYSDVVEVTASIASLNSLISDNSGILQTLSATLSVATLDAYSLGASVQALVAMPGTLQPNTSSAFSFYLNLMNNSSVLAPSTPSVNGLNSMAMLELVETSCFIAMCQAVLDANLTSRAQAIGYLNSLTTAFSTMCEILDSAQTLYASNPLATQYFSLSQCYTGLLSLLQATCNYLLTEAWGLAVAKYITLSRDRAPIEIALTEGVDLDDFISSNQLYGTEILLLPAGTQVVVYL